MIFSHNGTRSSPPPLSLSLFLICALSVGEWEKNDRSVLLIIFKSKEHFAVIPCQRFPHLCYFRAEAKKPRKPPQAESLVACYAWLVKMPLVGWLVRSAAWCARPSRLRPATLHNALFPSTVTVAGIQSVTVIKMRDDPPSLPPSLATCNLVSCARLLICLTFI